MLAALDRLRDAVVRASQIGKKKLDVSFLRRDRDALVAKLGEAVLSLIERGEVAAPAQLSSLVADIRRIDDERSHHLSQVEAMRAET